MTGKFQPNMNDNAFMHRIDALMELKMIPDYILNDYMEFSPVDFVAEAIVKSIQYYNQNFNVLHVYNYKHIYIKDFIRLLPISINIVSSDEFKNAIGHNINTNPKLVYITNDLDKDYKLVYSSNIKIKSDFSIAFWNKINFDWMNIDKHYINLILKNFKEEL